MEGQDIKGRGGQWHHREDHGNRESNRRYGLEPPQTPKQSYQVNRAIMGGESESVRDQDRCNRDRIPALSTVQPRNEIRKWTSTSTAVYDAFSSGDQVDCGRQARMDLLSSPKSKEYCAVSEFLEPPSVELFEEAMRCSWCRKYHSGTPWICDDEHQMCDHCMEVALSIKVFDTELRKCPMRLATAGKRSLLECCSAPIRPSFFPLANLLFARSRYACPFYGCSEVVNAYQMRSHKATCPAGPSSIECYASGCEKVMQISDYTGHLLSNHRPVFVENNFSQFKMEYPPNEDVGDAAEVMAVFDCFGQTFMIVKRETQAVCILFCIVLNNDPGISAKFQVNLEVNIGGFTMKNWKHDVHGKTNSIKDLILSRQYVTIVTYPMTRTVLETGSVCFWPLSIRIMNNSAPLSALRRPMAKLKQVENASRIKPNELEATRKGQNIKFAQADSSCRMTPNEIEIKGENSKYLHPESSRMKHTESEKTGTSKNDKILLATKRMSLFEAVFAGPVKLMPLTQAGSASSPMKFKTPEAKISSSKHVETGRKTKHFNAVPIGYGPQNTRRLVNPNTMTIEERKKLMEELKEKIDKEAEEQHEMEVRIEALISPETKELKAAERRLTQDIRNKALATLSPSFQMYNTS